MLCSRNEKESQLPQSRDVSYQEAGEKKYRGYAQTKMPRSETWIVFVRQLPR